MYRTTFTNEAEQQFRFLLLSGRTGWARIRARVHQRLQRPGDICAVDEGVFLDVELRIATLKIAGAIVFDTMSQNEILSPCGRANRISLHKPHLLEGAIECSWLREIPRDGVAWQVIERDNECFDASKVET